MTVRREDWDVLGLEPDADIATIKKAYRHRRSLYEPSALATYSLLDEEERSNVVERIEDAYQRIMETQSPEDLPHVSHPPAPEKIDMPKGPPPDPVEHPGGYMRHHRLMKGLSIDRIAAATKIGGIILEQIENEDFQSLPAVVFVRGHVVQFAREIGLDDIDEFAKVYVARMDGADHQEE